MFVDLDLAVDAGYVCSSLAEIWLESGDAELSETQARKALDLLDGRVDHLQEIGTAQLTLGRRIRGAGTARRCGAVDRGSRRDVRAGALGEPSQLRVARARRRREPARQRPRGGRALSTRCAIAAGASETRGHEPASLRAGGRPIELCFRVALAAVEPAAAEGGEEAGERRHCNDEVTRLSLGEHSRTSFRYVACLPRLSARGTVGHPRTGDPPGLASAGSRYVARDAQRFASSSASRMLVRLNVPRRAARHQMALWDMAPV